LVNQTFDSLLWQVNNGNVEPHRGFGHIAVMTKDVYAACAELEANGVSFQKKPDEGRLVYCFVRYSAS
jgi:lactoylglutathione lyase